MADRTVRVRLVADVSGFSGTMRSAAGDAERLGTAATSAGRGLTALSAEATGVRAGLSETASAARTTGTALRETGTAATGVRAGLAQAATSARSTRTELASLSTGTAGAARGLRGVSAEGPATERAFEGMRESAARFRETAMGLGEILVGGEIIKGLGEIVEQGNEYNDSLNKFQEVTRASGVQMRLAAQEAQALGSDLRLPQSSAAQAADAMVELAKAGLSAQDAISATKGTIELASAARTDVATAARIEGDALDQFGLKASDATHVADVLANVANSTSGELTDLAYALKYVGPIAHSMGISIQDATTAVGLLGKSGIIGETAGTALRSALVNMARDSGPSAKGLKELGIQAYDSQGNFKGLQYVITQLGIAQGKMSSQTFTAAAAMAFGKPALSAITALAHQGAQNWDQMSVSVGRVGGAASLAAAESKGLGGAMRSLGKEMSSTFLQIYLGISPALQKVTRGLSGAVADGLPYLQRGIKDAEDLWDIYGPDVEAKIDKATAAIGQKAASWVQPTEAALTTLAVSAVPTVVTAFGTVQTALRNVEAAIKPVTAGVSDMVSSVTSSSGALGTLEARLQTSGGAITGTMHALGGATAVLGPIGSLVGGLARDFGALPGPIQLSLISMLALRPIRPQIQQLQATVVGYGRSAVSTFQGIGGAMRTQQILASQAGVSLGRVGAAMAALEARSPAIQVMGTAFRSARGEIDPTASSITRLGGTLRGISAGAAAGALTGLKSAASGLLGVMGGPWGLTMMAGFTLLDYFAQKSAAAKQAVADMTSALKEDSGAIGQNTKALVEQNLESAGAFKAAKQYGISQNLAMQAALGSVPAMKQVNALLAANATVSLGAHTSLKALTPTAQKLFSTLTSQTGNVSKAEQAYKDYVAAMGSAGDSAGQAVNPITRLKGDITTLGDSTADATSKAQALHEAIDLLSGGSLDVQAAQEQMNEAITQVNSAWQDGIDKSKGYGKSLLETNGTLDTTTSNAQNLWTQLQNLNTQTAATAQASYDLAKTNGTSVPQALKQSEAAMQKAWQTAVTAGEKFGLTADQAKMLAAQMGFIPSNLAITLGVKDLGQTAADLTYAQGLIGHLPSGKSIMISALTAQADKDLEEAGFKIKQLPGGRLIEISVPTGNANAATAKIQSDIDSISGKSVTVSVRTVTTTVNGNQVQHGYADGGIARFAGGSERHVAQIAPAGAMRLWAEPETGGEAYIPLSPAKRTRSTDILSVVAKGFGYRLEKYAQGGLSGVQRFAVGGFTYAPTDPADPLQTLGVDSAMDRYDDAMDKVTSAASTLSSAQKTLTKDTTATRLAEEKLDAVRSGRHTVTQLRDAEAALSKARATEAAQAKAVASDRSKLNAADKSAGLKAGTTSTAFSLAAYQKQLDAASKANAAWESQLASIGKRAGAGVEETLREMGTDGQSLVAALSKAKGSQFADIVKQLEALDPAAKSAAASLADYTSQMKANTSSNSTFQQNLLKLASMGDTALAQQLAAQGDDSAAAIAAAAVKSPTSASAANAAATSNANLLSGDDVTNALALIGELRAHPGIGLGQVLSDTGIDLATLEALVPKIKSQLTSLPKGDTATFLSQLAGQQGLTAMARGGILTRPTAVLAAEAGSPEAWIPINGSARSAGLLSSVAGMLGYQLTPVGPGSGRRSASGPTHVTRHAEVHLHGARQSTAEQAADIARHMLMIG